MNIEQSGQLGLCRQLPSSQASLSLQTTPSTSRTNRLTWLNGDDF